MSDEGTSADLHVAAPDDDDQIVTDFESGPSVSDQLIALRTAALDDLGGEHASCLAAEQLLARAKARRMRAAAVALDTGVDVEIVARVVGVSEGTIRNWAKSLEGGG